MQFSVGDKVVHPQLGPGLIRRVVEMSLSQGSKLYYAIEIPSQALTVYVPKGRAEGGGIRPAVSEPGLRRALKTLRHPPHLLSALAAERQESVLDKLETRRPQLIAEAVRDLAAHGHRDHLTAVDERLLRQGVEMLAAEMALVYGGDPAAAAQAIQAALSEESAGAEPA